MLMQVFRSPGGSRIAIVADGGDGGIVEVTSDGYGGVAVIEDRDDVPDGLVQMS